jgi:hypothetical protein
LLFSLPFKGVRMVRLRGTAARTDRTPGALRRAGRAGVGMVFPSGIVTFPGANTIPTQPSP